MHAVSSLAFMHRWIAHELSGSGPHFLSSWLAFFVLFVSLMPSPIDVTMYLPVSGISMKLSMKPSLSLSALVWRLGRAIWCLLMTVLSRLCALKYHIPSSLFCFEPVYLLPSFPLYVRLLKFSLVHDCPGSIHHGQIIGRTRTRLLA